MLTVKPGELIDILLKDVEVVTAGSPSLEVLYRAGANREAHALYINPDSPNLVVTRVAPAEWPPQIGDVWADAHGREWWCRTGDEDEAYLQSQKGGVDDPTWVMRQYGPMTLAYRKGWSPTPAADVEAEPEKVEDDKRSTTAAALLRHLADGLDAGLPLPWTLEELDLSLYAPGGAESDPAAVDAWVAYLDPAAKAGVRERGGYAAKLAWRGLQIKLWTPHEPAADVAPPAGDAVAVELADSAVTAPDLPEGCVYDPNGLDFGVVAGAQCLNLSLDHQREHHAPGDDLSIAVSPDEPEVGGYWCTVTSQRCTAETDPCHLCPTAADPIPADEAV